MSHILPTDKLDCTVEGSLDSLPFGDIKYLFQPTPNLIEFETLIQQSGLNGFKFYNVVVRCRGKVILLLPLFEVHYDISLFLKSWMSRIVHQLANIVPQLLRPRVLAVGFVEGEWGEIGIDGQIDEETFQSAWDLALKTLHKFAASQKTDILAWANFNCIGRRFVPQAHLKEFSAAVSLPCAQVPIYYNSINDYFHSLSKNTRKDLRRKMRKAGHIKVVRTREPKPWLEAIYGLYQEEVKNAEIVFGVQSKALFEQVCQAVPGAEYVLYFLNKTLLAFNLIVIHPHCLVDKYFAMDFHLGRQYNLYFISWLENIRYCIEKNIPLYHAGQTAEKTKARLGARFHPSQILFKHRNPVWHHLLSACRKFLSYKPEIPLSPMILDDKKGEALVVPDEGAVTAQGDLRKTENLLRVCLDIDGSIPRQKKLAAELRQFIFLESEEKRLRLWPKHAALKTLHTVLETLKLQYPQPWLTFFGSGDFHYMTSLLIKTLPESMRPVTLVLFDNHPDWFTDWPRYHCGNWLQNVLALPWVESVVMIGQDSNDLEGWKFRSVPFRELRAGRIKLYPYKRKRIRIPLRWPSYVLGAAKSVRHIYGIDLHLKTLASRGATNLFHEIAQDLGGKNIYLSIDKDCLQTQFAATDWEQGKMTLDELLFGIQILLKSCRFAGADVCGEHAPKPLCGIWKRWDAKRNTHDFSHPNHIDAVNEQTNLCILKAFLRTDVIPLPQYYSESDKIEFKDPTLIPR